MFHGEAERTGHRITRGKRGLRNRPRCFGMCTPFSSGSAVEDQGESRALEEVGGVAIIFARPCSVLGVCEAPVV